MLSQSTCRGRDRQLQARARRPAGSYRGTPFWTGSTRPGSCADSGNHTATDPSTAASIEAKSFIVSKHVSGLTGHSVPPRPMAMSRCRLAQGRGRHWTPVAVRHHGASGPAGLAQFQFLGGGHPGKHIGRDRRRRPGPRGSSGPPGSYALHPHNRITLAKGRSGRAIAEGRVQVVARDPSSR